MRRFLAILLPLVILFSLTCCQTTTDPFSEYWTSGNSSRRQTSSSAEPGSEIEESPAPSRDDSVIEISWPDDSSAEEPSSEDEKPSAEPSEQASSQQESSKQETSKNTSKAETSKNTSRSETSKNTSKTETSRTTSGTTSQTASGTTSGTTSSTTSGTASGTESKTASGTESGTSSAAGTDSGSDTTSDDTSENSGEESTDRPLFTQYVYLKGIAMVWFPENWSYTQGGEYVLDAANSSKSQFITATYAALGGTGLTENILREAAYEELTEQYPVSKGYTVSKTNVTLNDGKHPAVTIIKSNGSEPVRQQIYLLKNGNMLTITFFANRSSDIQTLWSFVEIG